MSRVRGKRRAEFILPRIRRTLAFLFNTRGEKKIKFGFFFSFFLLGGSGGGFLEGFVGGAGS